MEQKVSHCFRFQLFNSTNTETRKTLPESRMLTRLHSHSFVLIVLCVSVFYFSFSPSFRFGFITVAISELPNCEQTFRFKCNRHDMGFCCSLLKKVFLNFFHWIAEFKCWAHVTCHIKLELICKTTIQCQNLWLLQTNQWINKLSIQNKGKQIISYIVVKNENSFSSSLLTVDFLQSNLMKSDILFCSALKVNSVISFHDHVRPL